MPLMKSGSKAAFSHNVKAEMNSGKPQKQALAIAYSAKRHARRMYKGGEIEQEALSNENYPAHEEEPIEDLAMPDELESSEQDLGAQEEQKPDKLSNIMRTIRMRHMSRK